MNRIKQIWLAENIGKSFSHTNAYVRNHSQSRFEQLFEIDRFGLDDMDKRILRTLAQNYNGGTVGLGTIGVAVGEDEHTLEEVHEPYLIQEGYIARTSQGRVLTERGWNVCGIDRDPTKHHSLF